MKKIIILGAAGHIAQKVTATLEKDSNIELTLFARHPQKISAQTTLPIIKGDALSEKDLTAALKGQDIVYANLGPYHVDEMATVLVNAMHTNKITRLIWISTLGVYDEVPGEFGKWNKEQLVPSGYLPQQTHAVEILEASDLDYTIIRPNWLTDKDEVSYEVTLKGENIRGKEVSRQTVAHVVVDLLQKPDQYHRASLGLNKPVK